MPEKNNNNEIGTLIREVEVDVEAARTKNADGTICGDGRVTSEIMVGEKTVDVSGYAGILGQDVTTITALLAYYREQQIEYNLKDVVDSVVNATKNKWGEFMMHTDTHAHHDHKLTGCGDNMGKTMAEYAGRYGIDEKEIGDLVTVLQGMAKKGVVMEQMLDGGHEEKGVLVVTGETHSLIHCVKGKQYFVVDPERGAERRRVVYEEMGLKVEDIEKIEKWVGKQDQVTLSRLAVGQKVFGVNVDNKKPMVEYLGEVQKDGSIKK